jgi:MFS family permease
MTPVVRRVLYGNFLSQIGNGLTAPLLIVYLGQVRGMGTAVAGLVLAYMAVVSLLLLPVSGILVDRLGPKPILMCGLLVEAVGVALIAQVGSVPSAFAVATVVSAGGSFTWSPQSALLGRLTTSDERQRVFGIQFMLLNLGIGVGGLLAASLVTVADPGTFEWLYRADALTYLTYFVVLLTLRGVGVGPVPMDMDGQGATGPGGYRELWRDRTLVRVAALGLVLLSCGYGAVEVGMPVLVTIVNGLSVSWVGIVYAVNTMTIVAMQMVTLRIIKNRSRSRLMALVAALWAVSWLVTGMSGLMSQTAAIVAICVGSAIFAVGETLWSPIAPALINDLAPEHLRGRYNSVQSLVWGVSGVLGPGLTALLLGAGLTGLWIAMVVAGCMLAGYLALRLHAHLSPALDGRLPAEPAGGTMTA